MNKNATAILLTLTSVMLGACDVADDDSNIDSESTLLADSPLADAEITPDPDPTQEWGPEGLSQPEPEPLAKVLSSKSGFQTFQWKKGAGDVKMGASTEKLCFLAGLNGTLTSLSDLADVGIVNNEWILRGLGNVAAASAICISTKFAVLHGYGVWTTEGSLMGDLYPTANMGCFLTRVGGKLDGSTSGSQTTGVRMLKSPDGTRWILNVEGNPGSSVQGKVMCIKGAPNTKLSVSDEVAWSGGEASLLLSSGVDVPCLLTQVTGTMASPGDWIGLWLSELQGVLRQNLGGNKFTQGAGLVAKTRCISVTLVPPPLNKL